MRSTHLALLVLLSALAATSALAQNYPTRPIRIIVPFPAGGPSDVLARLIGDKMSGISDRRSWSRIGPARIRSSARKWSRRRRRTVTRC